MYVNKVEVLLMRNLAEKYRISGNSAYCLTGYNIIFFPLNKEGNDIRAP